jgi:hypothetical protein
MNLLSFPTSILFEIFQHVDDIDLYNLMCVCVKLRNCIGKSDFWKGFMRVEMDEYINYCNIFEIFQWLGITKCGFVWRDYYSEYYFCYTLQKWFDEHHQWFCLSEICKNPINLYWMSHMNAIIMKDKITSNVYNDWNNWCGTFVKKMENKFNSKLQAVLKCIYVNPFYCNWRGHDPAILFVKNGITHNKIKQNFSWIPIYMNGEQHIEGTDSVYHIKYRYHSESIHFAIYVNQKLVKNVCAKEILEQIAKEFSLDITSIIYIFYLLAGNEKTIEQFTNYLNAIPK